MVRKSVTFALFVVASSAHAAILYNNTGDLSNTRPVARRNYFADDFAVSPNGTPGGANIVSTVTGIELGFDYTPTTITSFDILVNVYKDFNLVDRNATTPELTNLAFSRTYTISAANINMGANTTGLLPTRRLRARCHQQLQHLKPWHRSEVPPDRHVDSVRGR